MRYAVIGPPQAGKSTVFHLLTGIPWTADLAGQNVLGQYYVPDSRIDELSRWGKSAKTTHAYLELLDPPSHLQLNDTSTPRFLNQLRALDGFLFVIPEHQIHEPASIDLIEAIPGDFERLCKNADQEIIEQRLQRLDLLYKKSKDKGLITEMEVLDKVRAWLESGRPLRMGTWDSSDLHVLKPYGLLTQKPVLYIINFRETLAGNSLIQQCVEQGHRSFPWAGWTYTIAPLEYELCLMEPPERAEYMAMYSLDNLLPERLVEPLLTTLRVIRFYTVGPNEARVWLLPEQSTALNAAEMIHSDLARGFIRAEVMPFSEIKQFKDWASAKKAARVRQEGKDYTIHDGDILLIRFSV